MTMTETQLNAVPSTAAIESLVTLEEMDTRSLVIQTEYRPHGERFELSMWTYVQMRHLRHP